jgi:alanine or glycine:cation symporter, AGCS family
MIHACISWFNTISALPATFIFLTIGIVLTLQTRFIQFRGIKRFFHLLKKGAAHQRHAGNAQTISSISALFTAMATTIGMGNVIAPSIAIATGGPGALFWLLAYSLVGCVTKFAEVTFALHTRTKTHSGNILGGPMQYLSHIHPLLASWYGIMTLFLFTAWSATQTNALAEILAQEGLAPWHTGLAVATLLLIALWGGPSRVSKWASTVVPLMFILYVTFSMTILFHDLSLLAQAIKDVFVYAFTSPAAIGGFTGATIWHAMQQGTYESIFITEAGVGTSAIPHALANVEHPTDQGILALFSVSADMFLSAISGLLVIVTNVWSCGETTNTLVYQAFKAHAPFYGDVILLVSITLFAMTTIIGNSFNGGQIFASFTRYKGVRIYYIIAALLVFLSSMSKVELIWDLKSIVLTCAAIPNVIGIAILASRYPKVLKTP